MSTINVLDAATGIFRLAGLRAGPQTSTAMIVAHFGDTLKRREVSANWTHFDLQDHVFEGESYYAKYLCELGWLRRIEFSAWPTTIERPTSTDPWNPTKAEQECEVFDAWLSRRIGGCRVFSWGSASAVFDLRSSVSFIGIKYAVNSSTLQAAPPPSE